MNWHHALSALHHTRATGTHSHPPTPPSPCTLQSAHALCVCLLRQIIRINVGSAAGNKLTSHILCGASHTHHMNTPTPTLIMPSPCTFPPIDVPYVCLLRQIITINIANAARNELASHTSCGASLTHAHTDSNLHSYHNQTHLTCSWCPCHPLQARLFHPAARQTSWHTAPARLVLWAAAATPSAAGDHVALPTRRDLWPHDSWAAPGCEAV